VAALKLPLVHLGLAADFWGRFDKYLELERGLNSTFFVIPWKGEPGIDAEGRRQSRRAASYDAAELIEPLKQLRSAGNEIGLHGIDAWRDSATGRLERGVISQLIGAGEVGVRMHWLFFDEHSPALLEAAGFDYDATIGYNETVGYRAGTTQVYKPLTVEKLLELPLHVMDTALFFPGYLDLSPAQAEQALGPFTGHAARFGGVLTVNWHDRSVAPERLWDTAYARVLEHLRSSGACFLTASQTVAWFRKRRKATFQRNGSSIRIRIPAADGQQTPGLCVRTYRPGTSEDGFLDTRLQEGAEICLPA
jgi:peptidoglycan/xylan/chitin deacetylase (PgdA/CDA1 family)